MSQAQHIVVGIGGGIAAYKACHVIRAFTEAGDKVVAIPTANAVNFIGSATLEALTGNPVSTSVFDAVDQVRHVQVGRDASLIVVAPATADLLARVAHGRADDLLTSTILMATCPIVMVPAMHTEMWHNAATQANVALLRSRGIVVMNPAHGRLTGQDTGPGRMPEPEQVVDVCRAVQAGATFPQDLAGLKVVISAGGTVEPIDPVRFISNHSSGRQGYALADCAVQRGAHVTVVAGAVDERLHTPCGATVRKAPRALDMETVVGAEAADADVVIMAAAVADYRPVVVREAKVKKGSAGEQDLTRLSLVENPDILAGLVAARRSGVLRPGATLVGFAAETGDAEASALEYGQRKLAAKGCDVLVCNDVSGDRVFGQLTNAAIILDARGGEVTVPTASKHVVASRVLDAVAAFRNELQS